jgi:hypothetical protein
VIDDDWHAGHAEGTSDAALGADRTRTSLLTVKGRTLTSSGVLLTKWQQVPATIDPPPRWRRRLGVDATPLSFAFLTSQP